MIASCPQVPGRMLVPTTSWVHRVPMDDNNNHVRLAGRVTGMPTERELPSGDTIVTFRITVDRSAKVLRRSKQRVDTFECTAWTAKSRRVASRLTEKQEVTVSGELRRRFTRIGGAPSSWINVDVDECLPGKAKQ